MVNDVLKDIEGRMKKTVEVLQHDLSSIRTGRATPALLDRIKVEYYGATLPLNQLATISAPEARLLTIKPFDAGALGAIEKAIQRSDIGLMPNNDGKIIRLAIPQLTEERRRELVKVSSKRVEEARVAVRNLRRDGLKDLQELEDEDLISEDEHHRAKDKVQELTDRYIDEVNRVGKAKEAEILEV